MIAGSLTCGESPAADIPKHRTQTLGPNTIQPDRQSGPVAPPRHGRPPLSAAPEHRPHQDWEEGAGADGEDQAGEEQEVCP